MQQNRKNAKGGFAAALLVFFDQFACRSSFAGEDLRLRDVADELVDVVQPREHPPLFLGGLVRLDPCVELSVDCRVLGQRAAETEARAVDPALKLPLPRDVVVAIPPRFAMLFPVTVRMLADQILRQE